MARTLIEVYPHIVFSTKHRANIIHPEIEAELHRYIAGIVTNLDSPCIAVSGTEDHVHTLVSLGTTMAISNLIREVKKGSTSWLKRPRRSRRTSAGRTDTEGSPWGDRNCCRAALHRGSEGAPPVRALRRGVRCTTRRARCCLRRTLSLGLKMRPLRGRRLVVGGSAGHARARCTRPRVTHG